MNVASYYYKWDHDGDGKGTSGWVVWGIEHIPVLMTNLKDSGTEPFAFPYEVIQHKVTWGATFLVSVWICCSFMRCLFFLKFVLFPCYVWKRHYGAFQLHQVLPSSLTAVQPLSKSTSLNKTFKYFSTSIGCRDLKIRKAKDADRVGNAEICIHHPPHIFQFVTA